MPETVDIVVIGGGISGVSLAARLAPHARVAVLEAEAHLGMHATGRSAALLVEAYGTAGMRRLTTLSRPFFEAPPEGFWKAPLSKPRTGIVYAEAASVPRLRDEFAAAQQDAVVEWLEADELLRLCPLMRPGVAAAGFVEPNSLDLDANALLQGFAKEIRRNGSAIFVGAPLSRAERQGDGWLVHAGERRIACGVIANASGAWGDIVAGLCGVARCGLQPMRRTAATIDVPDNLATLLPAHPFVAPVDGSYYFKPDAGAIMVSLSEEAPSDPCDAYADDLDVATALEFFHAATIVPRARPVATWAGLRTFTPDRLPLVGYDAKVPGFFWYVGQGGIGIQTSPAHSVLAAKLVLKQPLDSTEAEIAEAFRSDRSMAAAP